MTTYDGIFIQNYDPTIDVTLSLLWQYNQSPVLEALIFQKEAWYQLNQQNFWSEWVQNVFTLGTANDFGLAIWGILLGLPLTFGPPPDPPNKQNWGFGPLLDIQHENFTNGNFTGGGIQELETEEKRLLLWMRYFYLTTRGDVTDINRFFKFLFEDTFGLGSAYILDNLDMSVTYVFVGFTLSPTVLTFLNTYNILPTPAAVGYNLVFIDEAFLTLAGPPLGLLEGGYLFLLSDPVFTGDNINLLDNTPFLLLDGTNFLELATEYIYLLDDTPFLLLSGENLSELK